MIQDDNYHDYYQKLRKRIQKWAGKKEADTYQWAQYILLVPDFFHLLVRLMADPDVPIQEKVRLAGVITYFILPLDLIPELVIGPTGFIDDIVLAAYALNRMINHTDPDILNKHWAGDEDILYLVQTIMNKADQMIGSGLFRKLIAWGRKYTS